MVKKLKVIMKLLNKKISWKYVMRFGLMVKFIVKWILIGLIKLRWWFRKIKSYVEEEGYDLFRINIF